MPFFNLFKNCFHYWVLGGVLVAYPLYHPQNIYPFAIQTVSERHLGLYVLFWFFAQMGNLTCHFMLASLRPPGTKEYKIPRGFLFDWVSCPNYTFEISGWIIFSLITGDPMAWFFTIVGAGQMIVWAEKKHSRYRKTFGKDYPKRKIIFPFLY